MKVKYRWIVVFLLFIATTINYLDRQVIGLLKPTLEEELNWSEKDYSYIVMAFTASYAIGLMVFGRIIDKIGSKVGFSISVIVWSIAAMAHAAAKSTFGFAMARVSLGLGESGNFPAAIKTVAEWFPKRDRALATGIFNSGANIGAVVAPIMVPWILGAYGWQEAFIITGAIGFIWLVAWWFFYEIPRKKQGVTEEEIAYIESDEDEQEEKKSPVKYSWGELFAMKQTWVFIIGKFMTDPIWWFFLFWIPGYFANIFALDLKTPSIHLAFLYTCTTVGSIGGGYLSGYFIKKGHPVYKARKLAFLIIALCTLPIITIQWANDLWTVVLIISLAASAHQAWSANIFTTASDMFPQSALSSVVGIGGLAGAVGGVLFPAFIGIVLDYYKNIDALNTGYNVIFMVCGSAYLLALVMMHFILPKMNRVTGK